MNTNLETYYEKQNLFLTSNLSDILNIQVFKRMRKIQIPLRNIEKNI